MQSGTHGCGVRYISGLWLMWASKFLFCLSQLDIGFFPQQLNVYYISTCVFLIVRSSMYMRFNLLVYICIRKKKVSLLFWKATTLKYYWHFSDITFIYFCMDMYIENCELTSYLVFIPCFLCTYATYVLCFVI